MRYFILYFLFLMITGLTFGRGIWMAVPQSVLTSTAAFSSLANEPLTTTFVTCDNSDYIIWSIKGIATSTGLVDICPVSSIVGACTTTGDTSSSTAISVTTDDIINLGYQNGSYNKAEVTTGTYFTGSWIMQRNCVSRDFLR